MLGRQKASFQISTMKPPELLELLNSESDSWFITFSPSDRAEEAPENLERGRNHGDHDDRKNHQGEILLHVGDIPEKVSEQDDSEDPNKGSDDIVGEEFPVTHRTHAGHKRSEGANQAE